MASETERNYVRTIWEHWSNGRALLADDGSLVVFDGAGREVIALTPRATKRVTNDLSVYLATPAPAAGTTLDERLAALKAEGWLVGLVDDGDGWCANLYRHGEAVTCNLGHAHSRTVTATGSSPLEALDAAAALSRHDGEDSATPSLPHKRTLACGCLSSDDGSQCAQRRLGLTEDAADEDPCECECHDDGF